VKRKLLPFVVIALAVAGCGKTLPTQTHTVTVQSAPRAPFVCHHREPAQMGECIRQELEYDGVKPAEPPPSTRLGAEFRAQGIDISRWQPHPAFGELYREGIRFVLVQGADDCSESNPYFDSQVRSAHEAGMQVGIYVFAEGCNAAGQAAALERAAAPERSRITLGAHVDAEVPSAYARACSIAAALSHHFWIVGVYGSPGTYEGGRCVGVVWPAEWGRGRAYPLPGYPYSAIKLRQWCGTCRLAGNDGEIDRDEDLSLIALSHVKPRPKPKPKPHKLTREDKLLIAYWSAERAGVLHRYHAAGCTGSSRSTRCIYWRHKEHLLWAHITRREGK
jgi:hypothetical protein